MVVEELPQQCTLVPVVAGHLYPLLLLLKTLSVSQHKCSLFMVDRCERWAFGADRCLGVGVESRDGQSGGPEPGGRGTRPVTGHMVLSGTEKG